MTTTATGRLTPATTTLLSAIVLAGVAMWSHKPHLAPLWAVVMVFLPAVWGGRMVLHRAGVLGVARDHGEIGRAGVIILAALVLSLFEEVDPLGNADGAMTQRVVGLLMGAVFVAVANGIPKMLTPWTEPRCSPANAQAFQRWYGWIMVLAGLAYAAVWLVAPIEAAKWISVSVLGGGMVLVAAGFVRLTQRR